VPEPSKAVLITGCSSGIGHAIAERLAAGGDPVYATARRPEALADLAEKGCRTLALDVTDEESGRRWRRWRRPRARSACW
jgi:NADP-dependent 3-hydroxy acid dehydrogenase YdfG